VATGSYKKAVTSDSLDWYRQLTGLQTNGSHASRVLCLSLSLRLSLSLYYGQLTTACYTTTAEETQHTTQLNPDSQIHTLHSYSAKQTLRKQYYVDDGRNLSYQQIASVPEYENTLISQVSQILLYHRYHKLYEKFIPQQAEVAQGVPGRLRPRIFLTFGTAKVVGRQPYAPAAFTPGEIPGTHFLEAESTPGHMVPLGGSHGKNPQ
jgi:hypothetical protein